MMTRNDAHDAPVVGWAAAAKAAGCSKAQVRRLVGKGSLQWTRDDLGRHVFKAADLEAMRPKGRTVVTSEQAREPSADPTLSSRLEADTSSPRTDGEVAALVFGSLGAGTALTAIVIEHAVEPATVRRLYSEWMKLKEVDLSAPSFPAALTELQEQVDELEQSADELDAELAARLEQLEVTLAGLARRVQNDPLSGIRTRWECPCGGRGTVAAKVECTTCGQSTSVGWRPEEEGR